MNWIHLIEAARALAGVSANPGRPRQANLKRAISTAYYAMFHALCTSNADTLIGASSAADKLARTRTYRGLDHGSAKHNMIRHSAVVPSGLLNFSTTFAALQEQRHRADYDPESNFLRSDAIALVDRAERAIETLFATNPAERRTLAALVLFRDR